MALNAYVGTFNSPTSATTHAETGVGFQPDILFIWSNVQAGADWGGADSADRRCCFGMATATDDECSVSWYSQDNVSPTVTGRGHSNAAIIYVVDGAAGTSEVANLQSLDSDGFTLNFTTATATAEGYGYLALQGSDITNAEIIEYQTPNTAAPFTADVTGFGFDPDSAIFINTGSSSAAPVSEANNAVGSIGVCGLLREATSIAWGDRDNQAATDGESQVKLNSCLSRITGVGTLSEAAFVQEFISDGLRLRFTTNDVSNQMRTYILGLAGVQVVNHTISGIDATGIVTYPTELEPKALLLFGNSNDEFDSNQVGVTTAIGATDGSNQYATYSMVTNGDNPSATWVSNSSSDCYMSTDRTGATVEEEAAISSFNANDYRLNWQTAPTTGDRWLNCIIFQESAAVAAPGLDSWFAQQDLIRPEIEVIPY